MITEFRARFPVTPCLIYGQIDDSELALQLGNIGITKFIHNSDRERLIRALYDLKKRAEFRIELKDFGIDLRNCKSYWSYKFLRFVLDDHHYLAYRSVAQIADHIGTSTKNLERTLKSDCNFSPKQTLLCLRNFYAAYLLTTTTWPAKTIATKCGFSGEFEFYKSFKHKTGKTTRAFRRDHCWRDFPRLYKKNMKQA